MGDIVHLHVDTCPVDTLSFSIYQDDGLDVFTKFEKDLTKFQNHLENLHENLSFDLRYGRKENI